MKRAAHAKLKRGRPWATTIARDVYLAAFLNWDHYELRHLLLVGGGSWNHPRCAVLPPFLYLRVKMEPPGCAREGKGERQ